jgi:phosphoglycolate phosphatase-like HAD superfamily hydrolase
MERRRINPAEAMFIGDSPIDIETGRHAGVLTVGVSHGLSDEDELICAAPDVLVKSFKELLARARERGW